MSKRKRANSFEPNPLDTRAGGQGRLDNQMDPDFLTGSPKQVYLGRSRLESAPSDRRLCKTTCTIVVLGEDMDRLLQQIQSPDSFATSQCEQNSFSFTSISEAMDVDRKLRATVDCWARKQNFEADVDYMLLSQVKGKGKA